MKTADIVKGLREEAKTAQMMVDSFFPGKPSEKAELLYAAADSLESLIDERDRLRAQLRTAGLAVVKEANSAVKLRARNEKLEAVLVAAEQVALAAAKEGT